MQQAPIPDNEKKRLLSLHKLGLLDTPPDERFDLITRTATKIFHVPISTLTLVDSKREWFKSCQGLSQHEGDRAVSFCGHALLQPHIMVIPDTKKDERFADNPMVTGAPYLRFYAGVPIMSSDGQRVGVFCIKDTKPREFSSDEEEILKGLASWAEIEINSHNLSSALKHSHIIQEGLTAESRISSRLHISQEKTNLAILNVMEDLEAAKAEVELEKAKADAMLLSIGEGIIATDKNARVIMVNESIEKLLGWKKEEIIGKSWFEVITMEDEKGNTVPNDKRPIQQAISHKKSTTTTTTTYYFVRKDKTKFPVAVNATPIILYGKVIGAIAAYRDITREREIDKAKTEFVSLASHQLRTPLGIMKWYLEVLLEDKYLKNAPKMIQEYFQEVFKNNERVLALVRELLSVSRIDQGRVKNVPKVTDLSKVVTDTIKELQPLAQKKEIKLTLEIKEHKLPNILIDPLRFHEVVENLIANAIEYTQAAGKVLVDIDRKDDHILISIKDSGIGISQTDQKNLFTKFFRLQRAVTLNPEGSGLGLYVVKSYINEWGGEISILSAEGKGSVFTISLPITNTSTKEKRQQQTI